MTLSADEKEAIMAKREKQRDAHGMKMFTAKVGGKKMSVITPHSREECAASCRDRFGDRFEGFL